MYFIYLIYLEIILLTDFTDSRLFPVSLTDSFPTFGYISQVQTQKFVKFEGKNRL